MRKYNMLIVIFCTMLCVNLHAKTMGFFCIHHNEVLTESKQVVTALETALFDMCFEYGIIATNIEDAMNGYESYKNNFLLNQSLSDSLDYLVVIYCEYTKKEATASAKKKYIWDAIYCKLLDFSSKRVIFEKQIPVEFNQNKDMMMQAYNMGQIVGQMIAKEVLNTSDMLSQALLH